MKSSKPRDMLVQLLLVLVTAVGLALCTAGCQTDACEEECEGHEDWEYEGCEECAEGPGMPESECADIWCS
jgi:hypothetical protein